MNPDFKEELTSIAGNFITACEDLKSAVEQNDTDSAITALDELLTMCKAANKSLPGFITALEEDEP